MHRTVLSSLKCSPAAVWTVIFEGGKTHGGGLRVYISDTWCRDFLVVSKHCLPLVEFTIIKCQPLYLPRKFTTVLLVAVYIPPTSNFNIRSESLNDRYSKVIAGDLNHADLKRAFHKMYKQITFATRGANILDQIHIKKRTLQGTPPSLILEPRTILLFCCCPHIQ